MTVITPPQPLLPLRAILLGPDWEVPLALDEAGEFTTPFGLTITDIEPQELRDLSRKLGRNFYNPANCSGGSFTAPVGKRLDLNLSNETALPWEYARHIKGLHLGSRVTLIETDSARVTETQWENCYVIATPKVERLVSEEGWANEYYAVQLSLVWISAR